MNFDTGRFILKIAETSEELHDEQRLRYKVFVEEMGANVADDCHASRMEYDKFDQDFDHLILIDSLNRNTAENVVGVYRLMLNTSVSKNRGFYSSSEYNLDKLIKADRKILELGRSCIDKQHRGGVALHMMWNGLAQYVIDNNVEVLFGVASFHGVDINLINHALSYLHYNHLAPVELRPIAIGENKIDMNILNKSDVEKMSALKQIPPLIKAYIRLGGFIGFGASVDVDFNSIDVCLVMDTKNMSEKYKKFYSQGIN